MFSASQLRWEDKQKWGHQTLIVHSKCRNVFGSIQCDCVMVDNWSKSLSLSFLVTDTDIHARRSTRMVSTSGTSWCDGVHYPLLAISPVGQTFCQKLFHQGWPCVFDFIWKAMLTTCGSRILIQMRMQLWSSNAHLNSLDWQQCLQWARKCSSWSVRVQELNSLQVGKTFLFTKCRCLSVCGKCQRRIDQSLDHTWIADFQSQNQGFQWSSRKAFCTHQCLDSLLFWEWNQHSANLVITVSLTRNEWIWWLHCHWCRKAMESCATNVSTKNENDTTTPAKTLTITGRTRNQKRHGGRFCYQRARSISAVEHRWMMTHFSTGEKKRIVFPHGKKKTGRTDSFPMLRVTNVVFNC